METKYNETEPMINDVGVENYNKICNTVLDFIMSYKSEDKLIQKNFELKRDHTNRVVGYSEVIARSLELDENDEMIVQLIALLHDIGRFEQMAKYETFDDQESCDHAQLAVDIIHEKEWINHLPKHIQEYIIGAIANHNKLTIQTNGNDKLVLFSNIIRDADKIDILDLTIKEYLKPSKSRNEKITLGLEEKPYITKSVIKSVINGKPVNKKDFKTINDFKLMQMSWIYDINVSKTYDIINKKQFLKHIFDNLPKTDAVFEAYRKAKIHIENQLN